MDQGVKPFYRLIKATGVHAFMHPCCICGDENAMFGFDVKLRKGEPGFWLCGKHKDQSDGYRSTKNSDDDRAVGRTEARAADEAERLPAVVSERKDQARGSAASDSLFGSSDPRF